MTPQSQLSKHIALSTLFAGAALGGLPVNAQNQPSADKVATFALYNVGFSDGNTASGIFTYDFTTGAATSVNVSAEGGIFNNLPSYPTNITTTSFEGNYDTQQTSYNFAFVLDKPLTPTSGSNITLDPNQSYLIVDQSGNGGIVTTSYVTSGRVDLYPAPIPEASSAVSLGMGLLALGGLALGVRRRRAQ